MNDPEFDADGYPTTRTLRAIRTWPISQPSDAGVLLAFVQRAWKYPTYFTRSIRRTREWKGQPLAWTWSVSTGGWSGNESLIAAMERNWMFWMLAWQSSRRGGHYVFRTP